MYKDLERIDEAIVLERGRENPKNKKGYGAQHILKHIQDEQAEGYVTKYEVVNLGKNVRVFLKDNEPFIDSNGARIYEWQDKEEVRFRLVVGDMGEDSTTTVESKDLSSPERIITFYSDRNLKNPMQFKNPALRGAK
ncbi:MAG: hypothetical protein K2N54_05590 [Helicobacter sp.]|nr:hypothetical protein [Helicobacter sp.]